MQNNSEEKQQTNNKILITISLLFLGVFYFITAPRSVTFEDAGLFLSTGYVWGLPHPSGYPLYTLLNFLAMKLPFATPALASSFLSILCGLGACYFSSQVFRKLGLNIYTSILGILLVGLGQTYWNQMIVPEVYPLHVLIFTWLWSLSFDLVKNFSRKKAIGFCAVLGLGLANHWPLLILSSPVILIPLWPIRKQIFKILPYLMISVLVAGFFYVLMMYRSQQHPAFMFLGQIDGFGDLWKYISRDYYKVSEGLTPFKPIEAIKFVLGYFYTQFYVELGPIPVLFFIFGVYSIYKVNKNLFLCLIFGLLSTPVLLTLVLYFEFNELNYNVYRVFHLIPHISFVALVLMGFQKLSQKWRKTSIALIVASLMMALVQSYRVNNFSGDDLAEGYAKLILDSLPQGAILFAATDADVGPMAYVTGVLGHRSDIRLMTQTGVFFPEKIFDPYVFGKNRRINETKDFLIKNAPVFSTKKFDILEKEKNLPLSFKYNGIYYLVDNSFTSEPPKTEEMVKRASDLAARQLQRRTLFNWTYHRDVVMARLCNLMVLNGLEKHVAFQENRACALILAKHLRAKKQFHESSLILRSIIEKDSRWMVSGEKLDMYNVDLLNQLEWVNKGITDGTAKIEYLRQAVDYAAQSLDLYDGCDHPIVELINSIQPQPGWTPKTVESLNKFEHCQKKAKAPLQK